MKKLESNGKKSRITMQNKKINSLKLIYLVLSNKFLHKLRYIFWTVIEKHENSGKSLVPD